MKLNVNCGFLLLTVLLYSLLGLTPTTTAQNESVGSASPHSTQPPSLTLSPADKRVPYLAAFSPGIVMPYWDNGFLIIWRIGARDAHDVSAETPMIALYDASGNKVFEATVRFPGAQELQVSHVAVGPNGDVVASGQAFKADGTSEYFIAKIASNGSIIQAIQPSHYGPSRMCLAPDGTVWATGGSGYNKDGSIVGGDLLRHFDLKKGLIESFLPLSTFTDVVEPRGAHLYPTAQHGGTGRFYQRCSSNQVVIYSQTSGDYMKFDTSTKTFQDYKLDRSTYNFPTTGFALTADGEAYGVLSDQSFRGLFHLDLDPKTKIARWVPVQTSEPIMGLYGAYGNSLVYANKNDPMAAAGLYWSSVSAPNPSN